MSLKKIMKVLAVLAALGISVAQAGADDYGTAKTQPGKQSVVQGADDYGTA